MVDKIVVVNTNLIVITYEDRASIMLRTDDGTAMQLLTMMLNPNRQDDETCLINLDVA